MVYLFLTELQKQLLCYKMEILQLVTLIIQAQVLFSNSSSGSALTIRQSGDQYGASSISMMNRTGSDGFIVSNGKPNSRIN